MTELLKHYLFYSFHSLTKYDYMAIGWVLFLALLLLVLAAFVKRRALAYFLLFVGMTLLFFGPPAIKMAMDRFIRATDVTVTTLKPLRFSHSLLIEGEIADNGRIDYSACDMVVSIYRSDTPLKEWGAYLKPRRVVVERLEGPLQRGTTKPFRLIVDHFNETDFNATVIARCYP
jgi:hypothetical protein